MVHHLHGTSIYGDTLLPAALYVHFTEFLIPFFYRGVPFVAVSESTKNELVQKGLKAEDVEVVYNGVDHLNYTPDESVRSKSPLVVCVTRLKKYKGVHLLLHAMKKVLEEVPNARLVIAGSGNYEPELHRMVRRLGLNGCVEFAGFLANDQKMDLYRRAQVVVNPSAKEGWGLTVTEANACATPVVAAAVPGLVESVLDGETGFLYPHSDTEAMAKHIVRLLKDERLRKQLGMRSLEWSREFTWDRAVEKIEMTIERAATNRKERKKATG